MSSPSEVTAPSGAKSITVEATVIRADGTREPLGVVAYWHKNPLMRALHRARTLLGR